MSTNLYLAIKVSRESYFLFRRDLSSETFRFFMGILKNAEYSYLQQIPLIFISFCTRLILNRLPKGDSQC